MERQWKWLIVCMGAVLVVLQACRSTYSVDNAMSAVVHRDSTLIAEGERLAMLMCASCHFDPATKAFTGKRISDVPRFVGKIYSANLTSDPQHGIGRYTDSQLKVLLRTGIARDGQFMPYMLRPNLADRDIDAIISFLRSGKPAVAPRDTMIGRTRYSLIGKVGMNFTKPIPYQDRPQKRPADGTTELGKYLVDNLGCYHCHSKSFVALDYEHPEKSKGFMAGGNKMVGADGKTLRAPNLTFDPSGIAHWRVADLATALRMGITPDKRVLGYPMPLYSELSEDEIASIFKYLQTIKPVRNVVKR